MLVDEVHDVKGDGPLSTLNALINASQDLAIERALRGKVPDETARWAEASKQLNELQRLGFCWEPPDSALLVPGIPSFLSYAQKLHQERTEPDIAPA